MSVMCSRERFKGNRKYDENGSESDHLVEFGEPKSRRKNWSRLCYSSVALLLVVIAAISLGVGLGIGLSGKSKTSSLQSKITSSNLMKHLQDLEDIANEDPDKFSRAVQYGYNASAEMIIEKLTEVGYTDIEKQYFTVASYEEEEGSTLSATLTSDDGKVFTFEFLKNYQFSVMRYSASTKGVEITGNLSVVQDFCSSSNYTSETIALIDYVIDESEAGCTLLEMTEAAASAGVLGVIMMRRENDSNTSPPTTRIYSQEGEDFRVSPLPALGANYLLGKQLKDFLDLGTVEISFRTNTIVDFWTTYNVLAYTHNHIKDDAIIVVGSHLDSVPAGAGINDNGSGTAANLEMAIQMIINSIQPINKVLFAFWGAEELGLLGSTYFVKSLSEEEKENFALNLNYDMIGSPNYVRQIYNGSGAENQKIITASTKIQSLFEDYFESNNLDYSLKGFNGRSDYGPFIAEGVDIPAGGLATGADEVKSDKQRMIFGGLANTILDPCYHQACDTVNNVDANVHLEMTQAAAYVLSELMTQEELKDYLNS